MNEKRLFAVLVRAVSILVFLEGLRTFWFALAHWAFPVTVLRDTSLALEAPSLIYGLFEMLLALIMIRWPAWVVRIAWLERLPTIGRSPDSEADDDRTDETQQR